MSNPQMPEETDDVCVTAASRCQALQTRLGAKHSDKRLLPAPATEPGRDALAFLDRHLLHLAAGGGGEA